MYEYFRDKFIETCFSPCLGANVGTQAIDQRRRVKTRTQIENKNRTYGQGVDVRRLGQPFQAHARQTPLDLDHRQDEVDDRAGVQQVVPRCVPVHLGARARLRAAYREYLGSFAEGGGEEWPMPTKTT